MKRTFLIILSYVAVVLSVGAALAISIVASSIFTSTPYFLFWVVIAFCGFFGLYQGLLAIALSVLAVNYFETGSWLWQANSVSLIQGFLFVLFSIAMVALQAYFRRTRREAQETSQRLETILQSAKDFAVLTTDLKGSITSWSIGAETLFGFQRDEIIGQPFGILFTAEDQVEGVPDHELSTALNAGSALDERWQARKDGTTFYANGTVRPLQNQHGETLGFLKILRDLTVNRVVEQQRAELLVSEQAARTRLEQINKVILKFVAVVSHEVRSPLSAIKGYVSTLLAEDVAWTPDQQREFLEIINLETDRLTELTDQLLDYTRLEIGALSVRVERTTFEAVIKALEPRFNVLIPSHHLIIRPPDPSPLLEIDVIRISQVVMNLVGNAVRYCPSDTTITITGEVQDGMLRIDVVDEGPGIPPDRRTQIFDAFVQIGIDRQGESQGAGLGLSIAKGIVEAHKGHIWIHDRKEHGTTISFTLPVAPPS